MKLPLLLSLVLTLASPACWSAPTVLRSAAQEGSAPKFIEGNGGVSGHCPSILRALERFDPSLKFEIDPSPTPIKRLEKELKDGRIGVVCALLDTAQRNEIAHRISTPVYAVRERLVGRSDDTAQIQSFSDLAATGDLVVTQSGASYAAQLRSLGVQVNEPHGGSEIAMRIVLSKRARFYYTNELTGAYYLRKEGFSGQLKLMPGVLKETPSYLWASRQLDTETVEKLEKGLAALQQSGELGRIYNSVLKSQ